MCQNNQQAQKEPEIVNEAARQKSNGFFRQVVLACGYWFPGN